MVHRGIFIYFVATLPDNSSCDARSHKHIVGTISEVILLTVILNWSKMQKKSIKRFICLKLAFSFDTNVQIDIQYNPYDH